MILDAITGRTPWSAGSESASAALAGIMADIPRLPGAACRGSNQWDADHDGEYAVDRDHRLNHAAHICRSQCPALMECGRWLATLAPGQRPTGAIAGQVIRQNQPRQRRAPAPPRRPPAAAVAPDSEVGA